ncbi:Tail Collar domain protein [Paenibacillus curdlanolyticus YK9]|uniref:Tail Collar domain protein n=1 Tax=Paenibacillus curdlanolyticus YK9 TaxID=717606 RepID=E0I900_9BACL|nr:tail fiber protein [Paenibacillus curdlanolyticus]EFM10884.1 Tail Collar domain protein [Paenibacillus curdlanolyticus YK9]
MENFVGEIRMFGGNFAPVGWLPCDGRQLSISEYEVLFMLLGTTYGGDGVNTFCLPDLRGRLPVGQGQRPGASNYVIGQAAGSETVTLITNQLPTHTHIPSASSTVTQNTPVGAVWGTGDNAAYAPADSTGQPLNAALIASAGGSQPHDNMMPYLAINFIIATEGIFPSQS